MKRLSRHTVVVLLVLLLSCVGGMSVAVVAFGQSGGDPDATVPLGDYTATTPSTSTAPLSGYTTTTTTPSTTPLSSYTTTTTTKTQTQTTEATTTSGSKPSRTTGGGGNVPGGGGGDFPSKTTRGGPTHLAFTGGEPLIVGALGLMFMAGGVALHRRRRRSTES